MKFLLGTVLITLMSSISFAYEGNRHPAGNVDRGSYTCENSEHEVIAVFYVRKDGTSKKVEILEARESNDQSGLEGCYKMHFKWIKSKKEEKNVKCCPTGIN